MTSFIVIVPVLMFILASISLLLTIKYQNDSRRIDSLRSQRDKIQAYAEKVVTDCRVYLESQLLYARSRNSLEADKAAGNDITVQRSTYVYGLKDAVLQNRIRLHVIMELMHIEIANSEFPNVKMKLEEMFEEFRAYSDQWDNQRMVQYTDEELDAYADEVNKRIAAIVELFGRTQDQLTMSIHNTNLYADAMKHFKKITIDPLFDPITKKHGKQVETMSYKVLDVCRHVINYSNEHDYGISNLKLQKILYFIQAYFLTKKKDHTPCFDEKIEAWDFGPVVPEAYHEYKQYGSGDIPTIESYIMFDENDIWNAKRVEFEDTAITDEDKALIEKVVDKFADYSATDLVSLTHRQSPWIDAYVPYQNNEITINAIREYFNG